MKFITKHISKISYNIKQGWANFRTMGHIWKNFEAEGRADWKSKKKGLHVRRCPIFFTEKQNIKKVYKSYYYALVHPYILYGLPIWGSIIYGVSIQVFF